MQQTIFIHSETNFVRVFVSLTNMLYMYLHVNCKFYVRIN